MPERMPKDIEQMLDKLDDPEEIMRLQQKWLEYAHANDNYERNYSIQFANLVEGNQKFKEYKTIPTPAEQLAGYKEAIRDEIEDMLHEQEMTRDEQLYEEKGDDAVYELEDKGTVEKDTPDKGQEFKLEFGYDYDLDEPEPEHDKEDMEYEDE